MVWDIFDEMRKMQKEMDDLFREFFQQPSYRQLGPGRAVGRAEPQEGMPLMREALVDVQETDKDVIITAELPGMEKKDIELRVTAKNVEIKAQKKEERTKEQERYTAYGKRYAGFYQSVPLPSSVRTDEAKATYKNGVLEVMLPKEEVAASHNIKID